MDAQSLLEAMELECVPEFLQAFSGRTPAFQGKHVELALKSDGTRRRVEGLKTSEVGNMDQITHWKNIDFVNSFVTSGINVRFENCRFIDGQWYQSDSSSSRFVNCEFIKANFLFAVANTLNCRFVNCTIGPRAEACWFDIESTIERSRVAEGKFREGGFTFTQFTESELRATHWHRVKFDRTSFTDCTFQTETSFIQCDWLKLHIDRVFLESLGPNRGGINDPTIRMHFTVHDPITELRLAFGGWRRFIHVATMCLFLAPYGGFSLRKLAENWLLRKSQSDWLPTSQSNVVSDSVAGLTGKIETEWLLTSLMRFAFLDSKNHVSWQTFVSVVTVFIFATYNMARIVLLIKSRELEHKHEIQGIWPKFNLTEEVLAGIAPYARGLDEKLRGLSLVGWPRLKRLLMWISGCIQLMIPRLAAINERLDWLTWQVLMNFVRVVAYFALISAFWHFLKLLTTVVPVERSF